MAVLAWSTVSICTENWSGTSGSGLRWCTSGRGQKTPGGAGDHDLGGGGGDLNLFSDWPRRKERRLYSREKVEHEEAVEVEPLLELPDLEEESALGVAEKEKWASCSAPERPQCSKPHTQQQQQQ